MVSILTERIVFPAEGKTFVIKPLSGNAQMAYVRERSRVKGRVDERRMMVFTLEACVVDPKLSTADVLNLIESQPEIALHLAVRIAELTTG